MHLIPVHLNHTLPSGILAATENHRTPPTEVIHRRPGSRSFAVIRTSSSRSGLKSAKASSRCSYYFGTNANSCKRTHLKHPSVLMCGSLVSSLFSLVSMSLLVIRLASQAPRSCKGLFQPLKPPLTQTLQRCYRFPSIMTILMPSQLVDRKSLFTHNLISRNKTRYHLISEDGALLA